MTDRVVTLKMWKVICRDETGGSLAEKFGNDEIALSAVGVDGVGEVFKLDPILLGANFDDKEQVIFNPPITLFTLSLPEAATFPNELKVTFLLAEEDAGSGHRKATNALFDETKKKVADMKAKGDDPNTPQSEEEDEGFWDDVYDVVIGEIESGLKDDVFSPQEGKVTIASKDFTFPTPPGDSGEQTSIFADHGGKYQIFYWWEISPVA